MQSIQNVVLEAEQHGDGAWYCKSMPAQKVNIIVTVGVEETWCVRLNYD